MNFTPRRKTKLRHWYHVSFSYLGDSVIFRPRVCGEKNGEPIIPRICVAPTVSQCISSIAHELHIATSIYVYVTKRRVRAYYPIQQRCNREQWETLFYDWGFCRMSKGKCIAEVHDAHITGEKWLLRKTGFNLERVIKGPVVKHLVSDPGDFVPGDPADFEKQKKAIKIYKSLLNEEVKE